MDNHDLASWPAFGQMEFVQKLVPGPAQSFAISHFSTEQDSGPPVEPPTEARTYARECVLLPTSGLRPAMLPVWISDMISARGIRCLAAACPI